MPLSVRLSPSWRTAAGRFAQPPVGASMDRNLYTLGQNAVYALANATPVRTGRMRASWRSTLVPTRHQVRITNLAPYWPYPTWGTRHMPPNANLQRVITQDLPQMAQTTAANMRDDILVALKG